MMSRVIPHFLITIVIPILCAACTNESEDWDKYGQTLITINLSLPRVDGSNATRAITAVEENRVDSINILALIQNSSGEWIFDYMATDVTLTPGNSGIITVTASVRQMPTPQQFVIIANGASELNDAAPVRSEKIEAIENRLICTTGGGEWPANNNDEESFISIPMYGRTASYTVKETGNNAITTPTVQLIRMLARIEVHAGIATSSFNLAEAYLFNYQTAGHVSYAVSDRAELKPAVPEVSNQPGDHFNEPTVTYLATAAGLYGYREIVKSIYTFESPAIKLEEEKRTGTALVVGGYYNRSSEITYYRIDLKTKDDTSSNISSGILRNHSYRVSITTVNNAGHLSPLEAYLGKASLDAEIRDWNLSEQNITDKQYYLNVSESFVKLTPEQNYTYTITAQTNYDTADHGFPAGIQVGNTTYSADGNTYSLPTTPANDWLTVEKKGNPTNAELVFSALQTTNLEGKRYAKVPLSAGNFTRIINLEHEPTI